MAKRLFIDLTKCDACEKCAVNCAYFYRARAEDHGLLTLRELATFALICRRCEEASCVAACKFAALERQADGILQRHNLRCVSCKCCSQACPFGTIYPEVLSFYVSKCDFCARLGAETIPCTISCARQAVEYREVEEAPKEGIFLVGEQLAVRAPRWDKKDV
jgi:Fe-S-cluster-containing hydrogenase component 2